VADRQQAVVAEDDRLVLAEGGGDALALLHVEDDAGVVVEDRVVAVERACVLGERQQLLAQGGERLAVEGVGVRRRLHVRPGRVHLRVDGERGLVHGVAALDDVALVVHQEEVRRADEAEVDAERVDPEVVGQLGVPGGDVAGHPLAEAEPPEDAERGGEPLLDVGALGVDVVELRHVVRERDLGHRHPPALTGCSGRAPGTRQPVYDRPRAMLVGRGPVWLTDRRNEKTRAGGGSRSKSGAVPQP
jgi:hypothetical protein